VVTFPTLKSSDQELYFLPDALLIVRKQSVAALAYQELILENSTTRFIEDGSVPADAAVVGQTWRFVNKNGGPDRRFNGNRQLAICNYGEMEFRSKSGLNCIMHYSNAKAGERFSRAIEILHRPSSRIESKAIKTAKKSKRWPTIIWVSYYVLCGAILGTLAANEIGSVPIKATVHEQYVPDNRSKLNPRPGTPEMKTDANTATAHPGNVATPRSRQPKNETPASTPTQEVFSGSVQQCLLIQDVDDRVDCLEQFRIQDR
jgi:hypothetical protein